MIATAATIARQLDADPVMARQVKEHISEDRLREVLDLPAEHGGATLAELLELYDIHNCEVLEHVLAEMDENVIRAAVARAFPKPE